MSLGYGTRGLWGSGGGGGGGLTIDSVTVLSSTSIQVDFSAPVLDNVALNTVALYTISTSTPGAVVPSVLAVTPENVAEPTYVVLTTSEMTDGADYDIDISIVEAA